MVTIELAKIIRKENEKIYKLRCGYETVTRTYDLVSYLFSVCALLPCTIYHSIEIAEMSWHRH